MIYKKEIKQCGKCNKFLYEDTDGFGVCEISEKRCRCSDACLGAIDFDQILEENKNILEQLKKL